MRSETPAPQDLPELAPSPSAGESRHTEPLDQGAPLASAEREDTGRGAGEPDGEQ